MRKRIDGMPKIYPKINNTVPMEYDLWSRSLKSSQDERPTLTWKNAGTMNPRDPPMNPPNPTYGDCWGRFLH